jgi:hypothetical protein
MAEGAWQQALHLARTAAPAHGMHLEQAGEHAALSLEALNRRLGRAERAAQFAAAARALGAVRTAPLQC